MAKGLSKQQKEILRILKVNNGWPHSEFMSKVKSTLYPNLWIEAERGTCSGDRVKNYGLDAAEKNSARVVISRSISRLQKRGYIEFIENDRSPDSKRIRLTPGGVLMVNSILSRTPLTNI